MIEFVSATRLSEASFSEFSPLGRSLARLPLDARWSPQIKYNNTRGLPEACNERINASDKNEILVFIHDDVWIEDFFLVERLEEALSHKTGFDIVGVAGNVRVPPGAWGWAFVDQKFKWDAENNLSGAVAHGVCPFGRVTRYGNSPKECRLLDGVFLAARKESLIKQDVRFDPKFKFHFYDLDFCRTAVSQHLRLGTWPISITHSSGGSYGSPEWRAMRDAYLDKWPE